MADGEVTDAVLDESGSDVSEPSADAGEGPDDAADDEADS